MKNLFPITLTSVVISMSLTTNLPLFAQPLVNHQTAKDTNFLLAQKTGNDYTGLSLIHI